MAERFRKQAVIGPSVSRGPSHEPRFKRDTAGVVYFTHSQLVVTNTLILTSSPGRRDRDCRRLFTWLCLGRIQSRVLWGSWVQCANFFGEFSPRHHQPGTKTIQRHHFLQTLCYYASILTSASILAIPSPASAALRFRGGSSRITCVPAGTVKRPAACSRLQN